MTELEFLLQVTENFFLPANIAATKKHTPDAYTDIAITLANLLSNGQSVTGKKLEDRLVGLIEARRKVAVANKVNDSDVIGYFENVLNYWRSINEPVVQKKPMTELEFLKSRQDTLNAPEVKVDRVEIEESRRLINDLQEFKLPLEDALSVVVQDVERWFKTSDFTHTQETENRAGTRLYFAKQWLGEWQEIKDKEFDQNRLKNASLEPETIIEAWIMPPNGIYPVKQKVELRQWIQEEKMVEVESVYSIRTVPYVNVLVNGQPLTEEYLEDLYSVELDPTKIKRPLG